MNILRATVTGAREDGLEVQVSGVLQRCMMIPVVQAISIGNKMNFGIRPGYIVINRPKNTPLAGKVAIIERLGSECIAHIDIGTETPLVVKTPSYTRSEQGENVGLYPRPEHMHLFDASGRSVA